MGLLLDIDGTVLEAGRAIPGAVDAIERLRARAIPLLFATNTSRKSRAEVAHSLREAGVPVNDDEILSASYAAAVLLQTQGVRKVQLLLPASACEDYGAFTLTNVQPEAVVVGDLGHEFDFERLNDAFRSLRGGARFVATQKNRAWKADDGWTLDAGAFVAALEYSARVSAEIVGKPAPGFFEMAARILKSEPSALTIVGDDLESDIAGGHAAGLKTVLVRTGKYEASRLEAAPPASRPDEVVDSIADLPRLV